MMAEQETSVISVLQQAFQDSMAIDQKLRKLIRDRRIDADVLAIALTRVENLRDDLLTAMEEAKARSPCLGTR